MKIERDGRLKEITQAYSDRLELLEKNYPTVQRLLEKLGADYDRYFVDIGVSMLYPQLSVKRDGTTRILTELRRLLGKMRVVHKMPLQAYETKEEGLIWVYLELDDYPNVKIKYVKKLRPGGRCKITEQLTGTQYKTRVLACEM